MPTFQPPVVLDVPNTLPDSRGPGARARSFSAPRARGVNVYVYADGTVTQNQPIHTSAELSTDLAPTITYYGGHVYSVTAAEAAVLHAAGYSTT